MLAQISKGMLADPPPSGTPSFSNGDDVAYNLEFKLPSISEHLRLPIDPEALDINHDAIAHSEIHQA